MALLLGLLAALSWGSGDFAGGLATRRAAETAVVLGTETTGLILLLVIAPFVGGSPTAADVGLGTLAGIIGVGGLALLYRGLAKGRPSVVAPISAVGAAVLPVAVRLAGGQQPAGGSLAGMVLVLVVIGVVA